MMHKLLADARFYVTLLKIDRDLARAVRDAGCACGGRLHAGHYPRKPRGGPAALPEDYEKRFSFCCAVEGCRARATPPSVRFFGRRWYLAAVVVVVSALQHDLSPRRLAALRKWLGEQVSRQTVERWRRWWQGAFRASPCWSAGRARFVPPVVESRLPESLLGRLRGSEEDRLVAGLCFLSPATTGSWARSLVGEARR